MEVGGSAISYGKLTNFGASWKIKKMSSRMKGLLTKLPSEYFGDSIFIGASTMSRYEIRERNRNGIDAHVGTDYPHIRKAHGQTLLNGSKQIFKMCPLKTHDAFWVLML